MCETKYLNQYIATFCEVFSKIILLLWCQKSISKNYATKGRSLEMYHFKELP